MIKITDLSECVPGQLYCMVEMRKDFTTNTMYESYGALAWYCANGSLYESDNNPEDARDITHFEWVYLVPQTGGMNKFFA